MQRETLKMLDELVSIVGQDHERTAQLEAKIDGIRDDLGLVRGGHARNVMAQNLARIANQFNFKFISELPQPAIVALSNIAGDQGAARNDAKSFSRADMVITVEDDKGQPAYVAIETSFTVRDRDVQRAVRNAEYLHQYTGLPTYPAVVGYHVLDDVQAAVEAGKVLIYRISDEELQPD